MVKIKMENIAEFTQNISPYLLKIYGSLNDKLLKKYQLTASSEPLSFSRFLLNEAKIRTEIIAYLQTKFIAVESNLASKNSSLERQQIMLEFCQELGASAEELAEDKQAFNRWFDLQAVKQRLVQTQGELQNENSFIFTLLAHNNNFLNNQDAQLWQFLCQFYSNPNHDSKIRANIIKILNHKVKNGENISANDLEILKTQIDLINDNSVIDDLELNIEYANLLATAAPELFKQYLSEIYKPANGQNIDSAKKKIFLKRALVASLANLNDNFDEELLELILNDQSAYVRQGLVELLANSNYAKAEAILENLLSTDPSFAVQGMALIALKNRFLKSANLELLSNLLIKIATENQKLNILRLVLEIINEVVIEIEPQLPKKTIANFKTITNQIIVGNYPLASKNWSSATKSLIWLVDNSYKQIWQNLNSLVENLGVNNKIQIQDNKINDLPEEDFGRIIAIIAQNNFELQFSQMDGIYYLTKESKKDFRLWRFLHEIFTANPDKRQNFSHTIGRIYKEANLAASCLAEATQTQVPGEPLFIAEEQNHRPFLPLLDFYLSKINKAQKGRIYSTAGVTEVIPPNSLVNRIYASLVLAFKFKTIAILRNWRQQDATEQNSYVKKLQELEVTTNFKEYQGEVENSAVRKYFFSLAALPALANYTMFDYFLTPHEQTLAPLVLFTILLTITIIFFRKKYYRRQQKNRSKIPLVIGGWGTRGKTGTERLKCAMLSYLGLKIVSKTTGCEPAIVITNPAGGAIEIPIIRPNHHATIDEQLSITNFAKNYGASIFLWECMALKDEYVNIVQNQWMIDDISTITNAHPDHEEIQGPSGKDVAMTISSFIRPNGYVITSEQQQQMLPVLKEAAKLKKATLDNVSWQQTEFVADDLLEQFPYYEHKANIALVTELAKLIGIDKNIALANMSRKVVPDIGALKAFAPCMLQNKTLQFINGMSANEELGCLNNWQRLGFKDFAQEANPGVIISTIINNRADRGSRSRVFAKIISNELRVSYHFLIGTNLNGMKTYIHQAWLKYLDDLFSTIKIENLAAKVTDIFKQLHLCTDKKDLLKQVAIIKKNSTHQASQENKFVEQINEDLNFYSKLIEQIKNNEVTALQLKDILTKLFLRKIIIIDIGRSDPDEIIKTILEYTPPNYFHKLVGIQNIKNPGLDFVKAWRQWETCFYEIENLRSNDKKLAIKALQNIAKFEGFSLLSKAYVKDAIADIKDAEILQNGAIYLAEIEGDMNKIFAAKDNNSNAKWWNFLKNIFKEFYDISRNIRNQKLSLKIYEDLAKNRISDSRAAKELNSINLD